MFSAWDFILDPTKVQGVEERGEEELGAVEGRGHVLTAVRQGGHADQVHTQSFTSTKMASVP